MNIKKLRAASEYFLKKYFYSIPNIHIAYAKLPEAIDGQFILEMNDDYDVDEDILYDTPGYREIDLDLGYGINFHVSGRSWMDPSNSPKHYILLSETIRRKDPVVIAVLMHELIHYYCWYTGRDYEEDSEDFVNMTKEFGVPSNYDHKYINNEWVDSFNYMTTKHYLEEFEEWYNAKVA